MYLQKVISRKLLYKNLFFVDVLKVSDEKSRFWIHQSEAQIPGSGSTPKCHGSGTLRNTKEKGIVGNLCISLVVCDGCVIQAEKSHGELPAANGAAKKTKFGKTNLFYCSCILCSELELFLFTQNLAISIHCKC